MRIRSAVVVAGIAVAAAAPMAQAGRSPDPAPRPTVVVALADSGVNPYHEDFYRPANTAHPCTWVKGFDDCSVPALELSVGRGLSYPTALAEDRRTWAAVKPGQWYWIPRTNIIGAVCDPDRGSVDSPDPTCILDDDSHGTGTASSVLSEAPDALLLIHDGNSAARMLETAPVLADVQSHSWGFRAPVPDQATRPVYGACALDFQRRPESLYFQAAGNEAPLPAIADCRMQQSDVQIVGGGYPGYWTAQSWSTYDFASWFCRPVARHDRHEGREMTCGTSFSAPTAAGTAAAALLRLRQSEGYVGRNTATHVSRATTRDRFVRALRDAASYTPRARYPMPCIGTEDPCAFFVTRLQTWAPLPPQAPYVFWGYGWLDGTVTDAVVSCASGGTCPAKSAEARQFNEARQRARHELGLGALADGPQSDAGSRRDAGEDAATAVRVTTGRTYQARLGSELDTRDAYAFRATAGQALTVTSAASATPVAPGGCWYLLDPDGRQVTPSFGGNVAACQQAGPPPTRLRLARSGTYTVVYTAYVPHDYEFSLKLER